jgi:hypothetical protein
MKTQTGLPLKYTRFKISHKTWKGDLCMSNGKNNDKPLSDSTPGVVSWPASINESGMYGLAGEFVTLVSGHTEADPNALLITFLAYAGNAIGRNYFATTGADIHCGNIFCCLVGHTGSGRKGSAMSIVDAFFQRGDRPPQLGHILRGVSSGEGVIWEIRDPVHKFNIKSNKNELIDEGVPDKRLLISLSEFQQCLAVMRRQDSILPTVLRQAWDKDEISAPAKNSPARATGAHVSVVAGTSKEELLTQCEAADAESGTLNRFAFVCSRRSKLLPQGGHFIRLTKSDRWKDLQQRFNQYTAHIESQPILVERDTEAMEHWGLNDAPDRGMYRALSETRTGLWGSVTARAAQQVIRFSLITAIINGSRQIRREHQDCAFEVWRYCDDSSRHIFGDRLDDPTASEIMRALRTVESTGLTRTQIHRIWGSHKERVDIDRALLWLAQSGIARVEKTETGGRPLETWYAV